MRRGRSARGGGHSGGDGVPQCNNNQNGNACSDVTPGDNGGIEGLTVSEISESWHAVRVNKGDISNAHDSHADEPTTLIYKPTNPVIVNPLCRQREPCGDIADQHNGCGNQKTQW